ncbi:precorrin-3B synthase [Gordonia pseudamarae]|uniref:Precorrin-3B synthase n=1 Tax=Gordonia pseudamarae TaxID=2831662 RepID=A0ABX6IHL5_9ACTN|nr:MULTISPECIES: precorrin-3B synthase [Gordonia]MBD0021427.1 precorrin-3B synthase [Gordonia sp. (in: high G+C Gram-positive bacteria)]QHN26409.1 precorrin-3B synthase [Gordonia pseudamarae]QHN35304.1 precorrin-3B synthase [Gordonia pseudamarae]
MPDTHRDRSDRCPGVHATHTAADGALARIRLPGGRVRPPQLEALATATEEFGDGYLELTARGNVQIRGVEDGVGLAELMTAAGLAAAATNDRARNIALSPLTGRIGGVADVGDVCAELDAIVGSDAMLTGLSGRFLFGIDDGRCDVIARHPDIAVLARSADTVDVLLGDQPLGSAPTTDAAAALAALARDKVDVAPQPWRIGDLTDVEREEIIIRARDRLAPPVGPITQVAPSPSPIVGWFDQDDGAVLLGAVVELARVPAQLLHFLAAVNKPVIVTGDREILLCDLDEAVAETVVRVLAPMGLTFDASSPWASVTCCVGSPGCGRAHAPVRDDLLARVDGGPVTGREHWSGCERGCGAPTGAHLLVEAHPDGYRRAHVHG